MKTCKSLLVIGGLMVAMLASAAPEPNADTAVTAKIRATLRERYPTVKLGAINPGPIPGLFELITDGGIAYTDTNANYLFLGKILDTKTQEDISESRWNALNSIPFDQLPLDLAIKFVKGNGKRRFAVFEDPHCPYCRQLETQMKDLSDATIYVFLYPIESLHPGATVTSENIWCAKDRAGTFIKAMLDKEQPPVGHCDTAALKKIQALADKLNINATPTLFFVDGRRHSGSLQREQLEKELARPAAK